jgi:hypothetical protein
LPAEISALGSSLRGLQNQSEVDVPSPEEHLVNVPLVIIGVLLLVVAVMSLLSAGHVLSAALSFLAMVAIVGVLMYATARKERRERTAPADSSNVSLPPVPWPQGVQPIGPQTRLSPEVQAARQSAAVPTKELPPPVPQSVTQGEWTPECSTAVDALIALRISKKRAIDLVRRAAGTTHSEILRNALKIHGERRTQPITGSVNGHAIGANTPTQVSPASTTAQNQSPKMDAVAALVGLGIPTQTATALIQGIPGNSTDELIRNALRVLRERK